MIERILLILISSIFLTGQFGRIEFADKLINMYSYELLLCVFATTILYKNRTKVANLVSQNKIGTVFFLYVFVSFFILFSSYSLFENAVAMLYLGRILLYGCFAISFSIWIRKDAQNTLFVALLIRLFSFVLIAITLVQYLFFSNLWDLYSKGWDPHQNRAFVTFLDVYVAAAIFGMLSIYWYNEKKRILSLIFLALLILSFSRSAYMALSVVFVIAIVSSRKWKDVLLFTLVSLSILIWGTAKFGEGTKIFRTASVIARLHDYKLAISMWSKQPVIGYGYNRIHFAKQKNGHILIDDRSHASSSFHSSYLIILVATGGIGLIFFLFFIRSLFLLCSKTYLLLIFILFMSFFDNVLLHALILYPFILLLVTQEVKKGRI